jgi:hypothetical protein
MVFKFTIKRLKYVHAAEIFARATGEAIINMHTHTDSLGAAALNGDNAIDAAFEASFNNHTKMYRELINELVKHKTRLLQADQSARGMKRVLGTARMALNVAKTPTLFKLGMDLSLVKDEKKDQTVRDAMVLHWTIFHPGGAMYDKLYKYLQQRRATDALSDIERANRAATCTAGVLKQYGRTGRRILSDDHGNVYMPAAEVRLEAQRVLALD